MTIVEQSLCLLSHYYHIVSKKGTFLFTKSKKNQRMNSYKLYAVNYADPAYEFRREVNTDSLKKFGKVDEVFEYGSASIPEFIEAHPDLFKYKFGAGMHFLESLISF